MRNLKTITLGLLISITTLTSCEKREFDYEIKKPYENHIYTGYSIGNGSNCVYTLEGELVECAYNVRLRVLYVDGRTIEEGDDVGLNYRDEVKIRLDKSEYPLLEEEHFNFTYDKIMSINGEYIY